MKRFSGRRISNYVWGLVLTAACAATPLAVASPPPGYSLVWQDEFTKIDPAVWHIETFKGSGPQTQTYVNDGQHLSIVNDNDATDGRALQILATPDLKSGRLNTYNHVNVQYGYIEARIKLPYGKGMWPAFWLLGSNFFTVDDPACGEMDVMENIGMRQWWGTNEASLHCPGHYETGSLHADYHLPAGQHFQDGYHLFQLLWQPDSVSFYVDGNLYQTRYRSDVAPSDWVFDHPFFYIINLAIGGDWAGPPDTTTVWPQRMLVDYVRLYKGTPGIMAPPSGLTAAPGDSGSVKLAWRGETGAMSYTIDRKDIDGSWTTLARNITATNYIDRELSNGTRYAYRVTAVDAAGLSLPSGVVSATPNMPTESPFGGAPWPIPGTIAACDYDLGGEGIAYHDTSLTNRGGYYRLDETVGVEDTEDTVGLYDVAYTTDGEWLKYTVDAATSGTYTVGLRIATTEAGGLCHLEDGSGNVLTGSIAVPATGGWQKWGTVYASAPLHAGRQTIKLVFDNPTFNVNTMTFILTEVPSTAARIK